MILGVSLALLNVSDTLASFGQFLTHCYAFFDGYQRMQM
jgi:hypothetical protein